MTLKNMKSSETLTQAKRQSTMVVPRQLLNLTGVQVIASNGDSAILIKNLKEELMERPLFSRAISLTIVLEGRKEIQFSDSNISLSKNQALFLKKDFMSVSDLFHEGNQFRQYLLFFDDRVIHEFLSGRRLSLVKEISKPFYRMEMDPSFLFFLEGLVPTFNHIKSSSSSMLKLKLLEALEWLNDRDPSFAHWLFRQANEKPANLKWIMEENYDKGLTVEDFAVLSGRSLSSYQRDFKKTFGTSTARWIKSKRLQKARDILALGKENVTSVALGLGYENISHFIRQFREEFGMFPSEIKNKAILKSK